jgi:putative salt-induced outer membrane protein YdiY
MRAYRQLPLSGHFLAVTIRPLSYDRFGAKVAMRRLSFLFATALITWLAAAFVMAQEPTLADPTIERLPALDSDIAALLEPEEVIAPKPIEEQGSKDEVVDATVIVEPADVPPKLWTGSFDFGLNGSNGNTTVFNVRFNLAAVRETDLTKLTLKSNYVLTNSESEEVADRLFVEGRNEWKIVDTPWTIHVHNTTEYDEFQPWRTRVGLDTGLGYKLIHNDLTTLTLRFGPSTSHEFRGPDDDWVPELAYGLGLEHKMTQLQKLFFQIDYFPDVRDVSDYRINTQASWEIVIDKVNNLSLKLSAISRYDSTPNNGRPDDLDYATTLLWAF